MLTDGKIPVLEKKNKKDNELNEVIWKWPLKLCVCVHKRTGIQKTSTDQMTLLSMSMPLKIFTEIKAQPSEKSY